MDLNEYQYRAMLTNVYPEKRRLLLLTLELNEEAGEVAGKVGKAYRDAEGFLTDEDHIRLKLELGDVLWDIAVLAEELGWTLEEIARANLDKLRDRQARGVLQGSGDER